jgi:hypothetical protein
MLIRCATNATALLDATVDTRKVQEASYALIFTIIHTPASRAILVAIALRTSSVFIW